MTTDDKIQPMSLTFLLAGGSGFIGSRLSELARSKGHSVRILTRKPKGEGQFAWDIFSGAIDDRAVEGADVVVNLAGAGIADGRWTPARKRLIAEHGEGLSFTFDVDPALLGGLRVRVGDRLIDNSVASRLATLRESLSSVVR